ncbi:hypothetical protein FGIG_10983 [Fasciola gigantica]|uniref:Ionotropic glutamate receptor C-terminal domain-containing protein n=1 Tax=Fasciola gigantica TaxID=46835 RepID=A0A504Z7E3_FASGI|nr:hypothetical protein FGIG_10983 [Fasciola gigantica]
MYEIEHTLFETWTNITESSDQWSGSFFVSRYPITERYGTCFLRMQRWGFAKDIHELLGLIQKNWIVFMESSLASYYVHTSCNMKIIGDRIGSWNYGIALPKNSALTSMIDKALLQLKGDSILEEIADRWWIKNNTNCMDLENTGLLLYELKGAFIIFATAIGTSSILFGIEVLVWRWQNKPKTAEPSSRLYLRFKEFSTMIINVTRFLSLRKKLGPPSIFVSEVADVEDTKTPTYEVVGDSETQ